VIDLETGYQPVTDESGEIVAVFNGEVYNFPALREELAAAGHEIRGTGDTPVLVVEGESIVGAKQNRVVVCTVLIGAGQKVGIPVGCVEQGRWRWTSPSFALGSLRVDPSLRKETVKAMAMAGHYDQLMLWHRVGLKLSAAKVAELLEGIRDLAVKPQKGRRKDLARIERTIATLQKTLAG